MAMTDENRRIQSVERAMALLEAIAAAGGETRLVDLSAQLGLSKSTLHGLLNTLVAMGYVSRRGTRYALDLEEAEPRLNCLALPLRHQGCVVAALGVAGPARRLRKPVLRKLAATFMRDMFGMLKL